MNKLNMSHILLTKRQEKGLTQEKVAKHFNVSKASISKWETGRSYPDVQLLPTIAAYYNLSLEELFGYTPELTAEEITAQYRLFGERYLAEDSAQVMKDIEDKIREYYSCTGFTLAMASWFLNYGIISKDEKEKAFMFERALELAEHVTSSSTDVFQLSVASSILAHMAFMKQDYEECFRVLGREAKVSTDTMWNDLISQVYLAEGNLEKSKEITQINIFQSISDLIGSLISYQSINMADEPRHDVIYGQALSLIESFHLEKNCSNPVFLTHIVAAQSSIMNENNEKAIHRLEKYYELLKKVEFPLQINRNEYFNLINKWIDKKIYTGNQAPTAEGKVKELLINAIKDNPAFSPLHNMESYKKLIKKIEDYFNS